VTEKPQHQHHHMCGIQCICVCVQCRKYSYYIGPHREGTFYVPCQKSCSKNSFFFFHHQLWFCIMRRSTLCLLRPSWVAIKFQLYLVSPSPFFSFPNFLKISECVRVRCHFISYKKILMHTCRFIVLYSKFIFVSQLRLLWFPCRAWSTLWVIRPTRGCKLPCRVGMSAPPLMGPPRGLSQKELCTMRLYTHVRACRYLTTSHPNNVTSVPSSILSSIFFSSSRILSVIKIPMLGKKKTK